MAGPTIAPGGLTHSLGDFLQIRWLTHLALFRWPLLRLVVRMPCPGREFFIGSRSIVTNQTIDVRFGAEIEGVILPAKADMTTGAARPVAGGRDTEIIDYVLFSQSLAGELVLESPGPVGSLVQLLGSLCMAAQASLGDFRAGSKWLLQHLKLAVICC